MNRIYTTRERQPRFRILLFSFSSLRTNYFFHRDEDADYCVVIECGSDSGFHSEPGRHPLGDFRHLSQTPGGGPRGCDQNWPKQHHLIVVSSERWRHLFRKKSVSIILPTKETLHACTNSSIVTHLQSREIPEVPVELFIRWIHSTADVVTAIWAARVRYKLKSFSK